MKFIFETFGDTKAARKRVIELKNLFELSSDTDFTVDFRRNHISKNTDVFVYGETFDGETIQSWNQAEDIFRSRLREIRKFERENKAEKKNEE